MSPATLWDPRSAPSLTSLTLSALTCARRTAHPLLSVNATYGSARHPRARCNGPRRLVGASRIWFYALEVSLTIRSSSRNILRASRHSWELSSERWRCRTFSYGGAVSSLCCREPKCGARRYPTRSWLCSNPIFMMLRNSVVNNPTCHLT